MPTLVSHHGYPHLTLTLLLILFGIPLHSVAAEDRVELPSIQVSCESVTTDSDENTDGSVAWFPTQRIKPAMYHKLTTRYTKTGAAVSVEYLFYEPARKPRGLIVLLTGGALNAGLKSQDGKLVSHSGGNFLIRSAHYFAERGYRVIGMHRPDDYRQHGNIDATPELYDSYRVSMAHAVDIAMVIHQYITTNTPVILIGSSRGGISAFAQQTLVNAILLSSPVTSGSGMPLGASPAKLNTALRPAVMLMHRDDGCAASKPQDTNTLAQTLYQHGRRIALIELTGGIRDSAADDPCSALDHHGFAGIESCAVNTGMAALENLLAKNPPDNHYPITTDEAVTVPGQTMQFSVHASDTDAEDVLRYAVPTNQTVLGGKLEIESRSGKVTYQRPANTLAVTDRFVYSVSDGEGGVSTGIVNLLLK